MIANGKRFSTNFRVACPPLGHRPGDVTTRSIALSTSAARLLAAVRFVPDTKPALILVLQVLPNECRAA
jgi:hypothetical protein